MTVVACDCPACVEACGKYRAWGPQRPGGGYMWRVEIWP